MLRTVPFASAQRRVPRETGTHYRIGLNAYSFNAPLRAGTMTLEDVVRYCAQHGIDAVDPTGYYFPGYPTVPTDETILRLKRLAHINGVILVLLVAALTLAPCASSALTSWGLPTSIASKSGVMPLVLAMFGFAPAFKSMSTIRRLTFSQANPRAVTPWSSAAFTLAPAFRKRSIRAALPFFAAKNSGVMLPIRVVAFRLAPALMSA